MCSMWRPVQCVGYFYKLFLAPVNVVPRLCEHLSTLPEVHEPEPTKIRQNETKFSKQSSLQSQYNANTVSDIYKRDLITKTVETPSEIKIQLPPAFNFASYVNDSPTLQELVKLGVSLYKWEKKTDIAEFILKLDFDRDMKEHIRFLHDVGVPADELGNFLTKNPKIFQETLDDLQVRLNYLESKNFTRDNMSRILTRNPYWLMFSTIDIDKRLGFFQETFKLSGKEVRKLAVKQPNIITYKLHHLKVSNFVMKEELGYGNEEIKLLLLEKPRLWMINSNSLKERFEYVHLEMKISHDIILKNPEVLTCRLFRLKERHLFLVELGKAQYDPKKECYVALKRLVSCSNSEFCLDIAKTSVHTFNTFLKTL